MFELITRLAGARPWLVLVEANYGLKGTCLIYLGCLTFFSGYFDWCNPLGRRLRVPGLC